MAALTICVLTDMRTSVSNSGEQKLYDTFQASQLKGMILAF